MINYFEEENVTFLYFERSFGEGGGDWLFLRLILFYFFDISPRNMLKVAFSSFKISTFSGREFPQ